jgi:hypothetical protein
MQICFSDLAKNACKNLTKKYKTMCGRQSSGPPVMSWHNRFPAIGEVDLFLEMRGQLMV